MNEFDSVVASLYDAEPYWKQCNPCVNKGKCCIGADVSVSISEFDTICEYVANLPASERSMLLDNILNQSYCIFRTNDKCLIHDVRPENCRYTPFQYVVTPDNHLEYTMISKNCDYKRVNISLSDVDATALRLPLFAPLENFGENVLFMSLNYLVQHQILHQEASLRTSEALPRLLEAVLKLKTD